jgi:prepilin-type N-terminal cleavage/methylation domain-containing protein/prepilin-type processing-associated H-X9-DG protein
MKTQTQNEWQQARLGLSLVELLVVLAILGVLTALLLPALGRAKESSRTAKCLNHLRQLQMAWQLYVDDAGGLVPSNEAAREGAFWRSATNSWTGNSSALADHDTTAIVNGLLYDYIKSPEIYRCPSDKSWTIVAPLVSRTRSYSMSGVFGGRTNEVQQIIQRASQVAHPAKVFVFIDESEASIDDGHFLTWAAPDDRWVNLPADRHGQTGTLSFADGHVEKWKWKWPKNFNNRTTYWKAAENAEDLADLRRLQEALPK